MHLVARYAEITHADGSVRPLLRVDLPPGSRAISSAVVGGGIGPRHAVLNMTVPAVFHADPVATLLAAAGETGDDRLVGMLTAVDVTTAQTASDGGAEAIATVGVGWPTYAAAPDGAPNPYGPGTINIVALVPVLLADAALVNAVGTVTEAKAQALAEAGVPGTGTASDAVCVVSAGRPGTEPEPYCGPRSRWGAPLARAVHRAVTLGLAIDRERAIAEGHRR